MSSSLADRYAQVKSTVPTQVDLVAVSKTRSVEEIKALYDLGHRAFGENYPQELRAKCSLLPADIAWHFIGHLQRSNARHVVGTATLIHSADSEKLLDEIDKRAAAIGIVQDVLLQVHIAREQTKHGFSSDELRTLLQQPDIKGRWPHVQIRGLMGMATNTDDRVQVAAEFEALAALFRDIRARGPFSPDRFQELSMGMTSDMDLALEKGSTIIRVGTAIFGDRN